MGVAAAVYALSSVLWVALLGSGVAFSSMIMLGARTPHDRRHSQRMDRGKAPGVDGEGKRSGQSRTTTAHPSSGDLTGEHVSRAMRFDAKTSQSRTSFRPAKRRYSSSSLREEREPSSRKNWCLPRTR